MSAPIPERAVRRLHHLVFIEFNVADYGLARTVAEFYRAGGFEISAADRRRAPQTCRQLEKIRAEGS